MGAKPSILDVEKLAEIERIRNLKLFQLSKGKRTDAKPNILVVEKSANRTDAERKHITRVEMKHIKYFDTDDTDFEHQVSSYRAEGKQSNTTFNPKV